MKYQKVIEDLEVKTRRIDQKQDIKNFFRRSVGHNNNILEKVSETEPEGIGFQKDSTEK